MVLLNFVKVKYYFSTCDTVTKICDFVVAYHTLGWFLCRPVCTKNIQDFKIELFVY